MAEYSFPHDAILNEDGIADRVYYAADWKRMLQHYFTNGLFPNPSTNLQVQSLNGNMVVTVQPGYGHINGCTYTNDEPLEFAVDTANANYNRIDLIVLRLDETERTMRAIYVPGTPSGNPIAPELTRNSDVWELKLAQITVRSGTQTISQSDILDTRLSSECGIVTCIPDHVDTSAIFTQYETKWHEVQQMMAANEMDYTVWYEGFKTAAAAELQSRYDEWDSQLNAFQGWFVKAVAGVYEVQYFDFDNPTYKGGLEYSYTETENPSVYTEYWRAKADGSIYATRTSTANADETEWMVVTVCESLGIHTTEVWTEQEDGTWKGGAETAHTITEGGTAEGGGSNDHRTLLNRDAANQHPIHAIADLENQLERKVGVGDFLENTEIEELLKNQ